VRYFGLLILDSSASSFDLRVNAEHVSASETLINTFARF
jgi:hypothetical protein